MSQIGLMPDITAIKLRNRGLNFSEKNEEMSQDINFIEGMSSWVKKNFINFICSRLLDLEFINVHKDNQGHLIKKSISKHV